METVKYSKELIEKVLKMVDLLPIREGNNFNNMRVFADIYNILNNPIKDEVKQENKEVKSKP